MYTCIHVHLAVSRLGQFQCGCAFLGKVMAPMFFSRCVVFPGTYVCMLHVLYSHMHRHRQVHMDS